MHRPESFEPASTPWASNLAPTGPHAVFLEKLNGIVNALEPCRCPGPMQQSSPMGRYSSDPPGLRCECNLRAALTLRVRGEQRAWTWRSRPTACQTTGHIGGCGLRPCNREGLLNHETMGDRNRGIRSASGGRML